MWYLPQMWPLTNENKSASEWSEECLQPPAWVWRTQKQADEAYNAERNDKEMAENNSSY